jgi:hypothetical protein
LLNSSGSPRFSPLTYPGGALVTPGGGGSLSKILYADAGAVDALATIVPRQAFAAGAWLPMALTLILIPTWFVLIGVGCRIGIPISLLIALSPASAWWSWSPVAVCAWTFLAAVGTMFAVEWWARGRRSVAVIAVLIAGGAFARIVLGYQPWGIPVAAVTLIPTLLYLVTTPGRRLRGVVVTVCVVLVGGLAASAYLRQEADSLSVLVHTVYPGGRRSVGAMLDFAQLFGAPHLWVLQRASTTLTNSNQSELSSGYFVLALVAGALIPGISYRRGTPGRYVPVVALGLVALFATWCMFAWPDGAAKLFPLSIIPPPRLGQVIGIPATIAFALMLNAWSRTSAESRFPTAMVAAIGTGFVTGMAGSTLRLTYLGTYSTPSILLVSLISAGVVFVALAWPRRWFALVPMAIAIIPVVLAVNPVQQGFGDLRDGRTAAQVRHIGADLHGSQSWAADDYYMDAFLMANAQRSLSGQAWVGPNRDAWHKLDPTGSFEDVWNRGASFVRFNWGTAGAATDIRLAQADLIDVGVDPCNPALSDLHLRIISSGHPISAPCARERAILHFGNADRYIYDIVAVDAGLPTRKAT